MNDWSMTYDALSLSAKLLLRRTFFECQAPFTTHFLWVSSFFYDALSLSVKLLLRRTFFECQASFRRNFVRCMHDTDVSLFFSLLLPSFLPPTHSFFDNNVKRERFHTLTMYVDFNLNLSPSLSLSPTKKFHSPSPLSTPHSPLSALRSPLSTWSCTCTCTCTRVHVSMYLFRASVRSADKHIPTNQPTYRGTAAWNQLGGQLSFTYAVHLGVLGCGCVSVWVRGCVLVRKRQHWTVSHIARDSSPFLTLSLLFVNRHCGATLMTSYYTDG